MSIDPTTGLEKCDRCNRPKGLCICAKDAEPSMVASDIFLPDAIPAAGAVPNTAPPDAPASQRKFETGAMRNVDTGKYDYEGFLSPLVIEALGAYMHFHRHLEDGTMRDSDNWQKGIPAPVYMKSAWRHFMDWWKYQRSLSIKEGIVFAICGLLFNAQGYLHELLKADPTLLAKAIEANGQERDARWKAAKQ